MPTVPTARRTAGCNSTETALGPIDTGFIVHIGPSDHSSVLFIERRLATFVRKLGRGFGHLDATLMQHGFSLPPQAKVLTGNARRPAAELREHGAADAVDQFIDIRSAHQFVLLLHQAQLQHLGLDLDVISVALRARELSRICEFGC